MANAAVVTVNSADNGTVSASSQALAMPANNLLTPHPSERWRSLTNADYFVLDKGASLSGDTVLLYGMTASAGATVRLRLSSTDSTGAAGDVFDSGVVASGSVNFDAEYGACSWYFASPLSWRFCRIDISDPAASYVEAGVIFDGLSNVFSFNYTISGTIQYVDRSRVSVSSAGLSLTWKDNTFRRLDLPFDWVTAAQRYGFVEQMDRINGQNKNVVLILDTASSSLARDSLLGLITDVTPIGYASALGDLFTKELKFDERL